MEKFVIVTMSSAIAPDSIDLILPILKCFDAEVLILSPVDRQLIKRIASNEGAKEETVKERIINESYRQLYELAERFKKEAIYVTIATKEMAQSEDLIYEIKKMNPKMLFLAGEVDPELFKTLREDLPVPIIFLPAAEK